MSLTGAQEAFSFDEDPRAKDRHLTRRSGTLDRLGDPQCWSWPVPESVSFSDDRAGEAFLEWWNRQCAICGDGGTLLKDHDHETLNVRGFLCLNCNTQEGHSRERDDVFARYRKRNPASILGVHVRYRIPSAVYVPRAPDPVPGAPALRRAFRKQLIEDIRENRCRLGLSQEQLAGRMQEAGHLFHQQTILRIEWGKRSVSVQEAHALATIFGITLGELIREDERIAEFDDLLAGR